jgi:hypothetical protein
MKAGSLSAVVEMGAGIARSTWSSAIDSRCWWKYDASKAAEFPL